MVIKPENKTNYSHPVTIHIGDNIVPADFSQIEKITARFTRSSLPEGSFIDFMTQNYGQDISGFSTELLREVWPAVGYIEEQIGSVKDENSQIIKTPIYKKSDLYIDRGRGASGSKVYWFSLRGKWKGKEISALIEIEYGVDKTTSFTDNLPEIDSQLKSNIAKARKVQLTIIRRNAINRLKASIHRDLIALLTK